MSPGLYFQCLSGRARRSARRAFCSSNEMCSITLTSVVPARRQLLLEGDDLAVALLDHVGRETASAPGRRGRPRSASGRRRRSCRRPGSCLRMRQRKSCASSSSVGALNARCAMPCGFTDADDVADDAALARGIHRLQHQQERRFVVLEAGRRRASPAVRRASDARRERLLALLLAAVEPGVDAERCPELFDRSTVGRPGSASAVRFRGVRGACDSR